MRLAASAAASVTATLLWLLSDLLGIHQSIAQCSVNDAHTASIKQVHTLALARRPWQLAQLLHCCAEQYFMLLLLLLLPRLLFHLFIIHQCVAQCSVYNAHAASLKKMHTLALPWRPRQLAQLLHCCCIRAGLAFFMVVEIDQEAGKGSVQHLGVRVPAEQPPQAITDSKCAAVVVLVVMTVDPKPGQRPIQHLGVRVPAVQQPPQPYLKVGVLGSHSCWLWKPTGKQDRATCAEPWSP
jgi:hypothetical protein